MQKDWTSNRSFISITPFFLHANLKFALFLTNSQLPNLFLCDNDVKLLQISSYYQMFYSAFETIYRQTKIMVHNCLNRFRQYGIGKTMQQNETKPTSAEKTIGESWLMTMKIQMNSEYISQIRKRSEIVDILVPINVSVPSFMCASGPM